MEPLKIFDKFMLDRVDQSWVNSIWDNDFMLFETIDDEYLLLLQNNDLTLLLRDTSEIMKHWVAENNNFETTNTDASWQILRGLNVDPRILLAVLGYFINNGHNQVANEDYHQICLRSTSLYLILMTVPGSSVYQIFHENLYQKVLDTLEFFIHLLPSDQKSYFNQNNLYASTDEISKMTQSQKTLLTKRLNTVVYDLILLLKSSSWSFRGYKRSLESTVKSLVQITKLGNDNNSASTSLSSGSWNTLIQNAYAALQVLCQNRHGFIEITIKLIAKNMMQNFLYSSGHSSVKLSGVVTNTSIQFLKTLLEDHGEKAEAGIHILIQRLMMNCPERLELRQKQAIIIVKLIKITEKRTNLIKKVIDDLILFSHKNKICHRVFAQEIIGRYLIDSVCISNEDTEIDNENMSIEVNIHKILLAIVLSRTNDVSSMVRGRALATFKEYTDQPSNSFLKTFFMSTDGEHHRTTSVLEDLRKSIHSDIKIFPDKDFLISMLEIRAEDERALVRRSAILIFKNVVKLNSNILEISMRIISKHCRDPAMTVRRCSIQVLTFLFEKYPYYPNFCRIWIKSVIPQIFDMEVSVQEKVLEVLENLIINRISLSTSSSENSDDLSWKIVTELNCMKMRKHLTKICEAWTRTGVLTKEFIINVQSKIESEHNQAAWILLSSISKVTKVPRMDKYFLNTKELLLGEKYIDCVSLEVLRSSFKSFDKNIIKKIQVELYESLNEFNVHPRMISITLDIIYSAYSENSEGQVDIESMIKKLISRSTSIIEKMIKDDNPKSDNIDLYIKAVSTLGHASFLCKYKIELSVIRVLQGIIIETMPYMIKNRADLQAAIVVVLGQQAMRDQSIAHEMMPIFRQLLCNTHENMDSKFVAAVRVNAAKALVDVCTRFTSVVEPFLPDMCITMKDSERTVREAIVILFIELLVEDFIKVKGPFFFHILTMLTDKDETIRDMTIFLVKERLLIKNKNLVTNQFFEAIFHYNGVKFENKFYERKMTKNERVTLTLPGKDNWEKRKVIYTFLLNNLEPIGWLKLLEKINKVFEDILCKGTLDLSINKNECLFNDILWIVSRDFNQMNSIGTRIESTGEEDEASISNTGIIREKIEKHIITVLLPTLAKLRKKMSKISKELDAKIVNTLIDISENFNGDQMASIYKEYPEIETQIQQNLSVLEEKNNIDEDITNSVCPPISKSTPIKSLQSHQLLQSDRQPRIILQRVSELT